MATSETDANSLRIRVRDVVSGTNSYPFPQLLHLFEGIDPYDLCVIRNANTYELNGNKVWVLRGPSNSPWSFHD